MPTNQEQMEQARQVLHEAQTGIFFGKLAEYGIVPSSDAESTGFWEFGCDILSRCPLKTEKGYELKQASCDSLNDTAARLPEKGFSPGAVKAAEWLLQQPEFVKAACLLLTRSQA
jgi:hypothetical protein